MRTEESTYHDRNSRKRSDVSAREQVVVAMMFGPDLTEWYNGLCIKHDTFLARQDKY